MCACQSLRRIPTNDLSFHPASLTSLSLLLFLFLLILFDRARAVLIAVKVLFCDNGSKFSRHRGRRSVVTLAPKQQLSDPQRIEAPRDQSVHGAAHCVGQCSRLERGRQPWKPRWRPLCDHDKEFRQTSEGTSSHLPLVPPPTGSAISATTLPCPGRI